MTYDIPQRFQRLFSGLDKAFGTGAGRWIKRPPTLLDFTRHLQGEGPGIGIAPLRPDNTVLFAAIDLDEPDFDAAREMQEFIPGASFVERSRSGNAHVWVFFRDPVPAWLPMGILREATLAIGKHRVEVFPKAHDFSRVALGNYINLPYHGLDRPILEGTTETLALESFVEAAEVSLNDPARWHRRAALLQLSEPLPIESTQEFGDQETLHQCAEYLIERAVQHPLVEGCRHAAFLMLAKCLLNWKHCDYDMALEIILRVNEDAVDPAPEHEIRRILRSVAERRYTSYGCDDPLIRSYVDPKCKVAHGNS